MSLLTISRLIGKPDHNPFIPLRERPKILTLGGIRVWEYTSPIQTDTLIQKLSDRLPLNRFDNVFINMDGGEFLFKELAYRQGFRKDPIEVEFHKPNGGYGAIVKRDFPKWSLGTDGVIIEDVYDTGGVLMEMMNRLSERSRAGVVVTKDGIPGQIFVPNVVSAARTDKKAWLGGCGMDLGIPGEGDIFRKYPALVIKIPKQITHNGEWLY